MNINRQAPEWACQLVADAFRYDVNLYDIAKEAGYTRFWVTKVMRGAQTGDAAKNRILEAWERIKERKEKEESESCEPKP